MLLLASILLVACGNDEPKEEKKEEKKEDETKQEEQVEKKEKPEVEEQQDESEDAIEEQEDESESATEEQEESEDTSEEDTSTWDDLKDKDKIVGVSNKDFLSVSKSKPTEVNNDSTGNWRKVTLSENIKIEEYASSYADEYIEDGEIHFIVNFANKTTTRISNDFGLLSVTIHEYVDKEEHDANKMPSGMVLKDYVIYPDGDIEEIK